MNFANSTDAFRYVRDRMLALYERREAIAIAYRLLEHCGIPKIQVLTGEPIPEGCGCNEKISDLLPRLQKAEPIQYVLGTTHFFGLQLEVNENVLIPRPETEELVFLIIREQAGSKTLRIADYGTGSGCIAVALKRHFGDRATVHAVEKSILALHVARRNAQRYDLAVHFHAGDLFREAFAEPAPDSLDVLVSNPPYVTNFERESLKPNVLKYEPQEALFVPETKPLKYYERLADIGQQRLVPGGRVYFEINERFGPQMEELLTSKAYRNVRILKDLAGKDRIAVAAK